MSKPKNKDLEENLDEASSQEESGSSGEECPRWIEFHVREDQTDKKLAGMKLKLEGPESKKQPATTDEDGKARLAPPVDGDWKILSVSDGDVWEVVGDPTIEA